MSAKNWLVLAGAMSLGFLAPACASDTTATGNDDGTPGGGDESSDCKVDSDYGCAGTSQDEVRENIAGPAVKTTDAEAWKATNSWSAKTAEAGTAWAANSGLTWEEKFHKWAGSLEFVEGRTTQTIAIKNPQGRVLHAPVLECADQGIFFRYVFAAWYKLPFYMTGWVNGKTVYMGHFGVVDKDGNAVSGFPAYRARYQDNEASWRAGQPWPKDVALRARTAGYPDGHEGVLVEGRALPDGSSFGTYLDELFLNKRAGHLLSIIVAYYGSGNLADGANTYQLRGDAVQGGDVLVERWQKNGIGHTMVVVKVEENDDGTKKVWGGQGYMPARQAELMLPERFHAVFKNPYCGGDGQTYDEPPVPYVKLGGGLRRWRTPVNKDGRWSNDVSVADRTNYIEDTNVTALNERFANWDNVLRTGTPEEAYGIAKDNLVAARAKLALKPASCSSRALRETSWNQLISAGRTVGKSEADIRSENKELADFVFAELIYNQSKTCCWLTPGPDQYATIMGYAEKEQSDAEAARTCKQPTVFRQTNGNYDIWKNYAREQGKTWVDWTQDESPCPANVAAAPTATDRLTPPGERSFCE